MAAFGKGKHQYRDFSQFNQTVTGNTEGSIIGRISDQPTFHRVNLSFRGKQLQRVPVLSFSLASHLVSKSLCYGLEIPHSDSMSSKDGTTYLRVHVWDKKALATLFKMNLHKGDELLLGGKLKYRQIPQHVDDEHYLGTILNQKIGSGLHFFELSAFTYRMIWRKNWTLKKD